jgi:hypothetical protein
MVKLEVGKRYSTITIDLEGEELVLRNVQVLDQHEGAEHMTYVLGVPAVQCEDRMILAAEVAADE